MKNKKITTISSSLLLVAILLFPLFTQFFHTLDDHNHIVCTNTKTHLHKHKTNCSVCDFNYTPFVYNPTKEVISNKIVEYNTLILSSFNRLHSNKCNTLKLLRGPPSYS